MLATRAIASLLDAVAPRRCAGCGQWGMPICPVCRAWLQARAVPPSQAGIAAAYRYSGPVASVIQAAKYGDARTALREFCELAAPRVAMPPSSLLVPVPLGRKRARRRGFNQAAVWAEALSERWGSQLGQGMVRVRDTAPQVGRSRRGRASNLIGAFEWTGGTISGRGVVIVDDVCTTGSTVKAAAAALRRAGAGRIAAVVLARTE
jgi:ComF family protein